MKKCIILANGEAPLKSALNKLKKLGYADLYCADGGANSAKKMGLMPDYIIGDLDSIDLDTVKFYDGKSQLIHYTRQSDTDVEKTLKFVVRKKYDEAVLTAGTGDRLDHSLTNLSLVYKYFNKIKVSVLHQSSILTPISGQNIIKTTPGEPISILGFTSDTIVTSQGLKYQLMGTKVCFGIMDSQSNEAVSSQIYVNVENGIAFLIRDFKTWFENK